MTISRAIVYAVATISIATGALLYGQGATQPTVTLTWQHPAPETVTHYWIERAMRVDFRDADILGPVEGGATTYTDHPTEPGRTYYRVRAVGPGGQSPPSAYVQTVIELPPVAPTNLTLTRGTP